MGAPSTKEEVAQRRGEVRGQAPERDMPLPSVGVIGAGLAGAACARVLREAGVQVTVLDKGRRAGGRMATRTWPAGQHFDHGAQYWTVRSPGFAAFVAAAQAAGRVARWGVRPRTLRAGVVRDPVADSDVERFVGIESNASLVAFALGEERVHWNEQVEGLHRASGSWWVRSQAGTRGPFDALVLALPASQASRLLPDGHAFAALLEDVGMAPCWTGMYAFAEPLPIAWDAAFVEDSPLTWAARQASRPARPPGERWVLHASEAWSRAHLEEDGEEVARRLLDAFLGEVGALPAPTYARAHRWRFARTTAPLQRSFLFDALQRLGLCGDWCLGARVEDAWRSGHALGVALAEALADLPAARSGGPG